MSESTKQQQAGEAEKATPGPWESFGASPGKRAVVGCLDNSRNIRIADVGDRGMTLGEIGANARLIAAAPDLLAACYDAEAAIEWEDPSRETGMSKEERMEECLKLIRAAIAKARGRAL